MELWQLRYFVTVAELENLSEAAKRLHVSQSPLGRQIRQLEDQLGLALFEHASKKIRLTAAGRDFLESARALLSQAERLNMQAQRIRDGERGQVVVGYTPGVMYGGLLPEALRQLHEAHPDIRVQLRPMMSAEMLKGLDAYEFDLCLIYRPVERLGYLCQRLFEEPFLVAAASHHPVAAMRRVDVQTARELAWILPPRSVDTGLPGDIAVEAQLRSQFDVAAARVGFEPRVAYESMDVLTTMALVRAGPAVALALAGFSDFMSGIVLRPMPLLDVKLSLYLVWRADEPETGSAAARLRLALLDRLGARREAAATSTSTSTSTAPAPARRRAAARKRPGRSA